MGQEAANDNVFNMAPALDSVSSSFESTISPLQFAAFTPPANSAEMSDAFKAVNPTRGSAANDVGEGLRGFMVGALDIHGEGLKADQFGDGGSLQFTSLATVLKNDNAHSHSRLVQMQTDESFMKKLQVA